MTLPRILATGAFLKNACGLLLGGRFDTSPMHGDLDTPAACLALQASCDALLASVGGHVDAIAHDLHPDFPSTRLALALAGRLGVPAVAVQHHHAHAAAVLAEHGLDGPALALALDGYGLGSDGQAWGGELLVLDAGACAGAGFERAGHLAPLALPGGDRAAREPWRMAAAALHAMGRGDEIGPRFAPRIGTARAEGLAALLRGGISLRSVTTTSAGRWFDAAAAALGLVLWQTHEAEAAIALEQAAAAHAGAAPSMPLPRDGGVIDLRPLLAELFSLGDRGRVADGAALFHASLADALAAAAADAARARGLRVVALGGGCLANRLLRERLRGRLAEAGLAPKLPLQDPPGDAALARGQAWVAARALAGGTLAMAATAAPQRAAAAAEEHA